MLGKGCWLSDQLRSAPAGNPPHAAGYHVGCGARLLVTLLMQLATACDCLARCAQRLALAKDIKHGKQAGISNTLVMPNSTT
mmetsp:Transcript_11265/g.30710  ORF Transcript_11265/g.30710 Transcript_11265/m.30710 type:complete len:82 (+) Transcript_11265:1134-1379(+)|eukprot:scaffold187965_cov17-Tisochrysis_lutea.AAC.1